MDVIIPWRPDSNIEDYAVRNEILNWLAPLDVSFSCEQSPTMPFHWKIAIDFEDDDDRQMMFLIKYGELCSV